MNRRRWLFALGAIVALAVFAGAKMVARQRPHIVGEMLPMPIRASASRAAQPELKASQNFLLARQIARGDTLFDLNNGTSRLAFGETLVTQSDWRWQVASQRPPRLQLTDGKGAARLYDLPVEATGELTDSYFQEVRVWPARNCVELMLFDHNAGRFCRWNQTSGALELNARSRFSEGGERALSRDGQTVIAAGLHQLYHISTRTGRVLKRVPFADFTPSDQGPSYLPRGLSPFGSYAFYRTESGSNSKSTQILDSKSGRALWTFANVPTIDAVFAPDESRIAVPVPARKVWEIRALPSGTVLSTLPLLPDVQSGAFSPDNQTLYSIANGVLYRQRAC